MTSWSYCYDAATETDVCLEDTWNLIEQELNCPLGFKNGWELQIEADCFAKNEPGSCPGDAEQEGIVAGEYLNFTKTLKEGEYCEF